MKLLMHACCAPCSVYPVDTLRKMGIEPTIFWYNPNIHPYKEYEARKDCLKDFCNNMGLKSIVEDEYGLEDFCKNVSNCLTTRCIDYCYPVRLRKTFEYAKESGYDTVTTTLLYSIYQKHDYIKNEMEKLAQEYGIDFLYIDFRKGFWEGQERAKELGLYMQKYCGCVFSEEDSLKAHINNKPKLPEGFEFLPVTRTIVIKKEKEKIEKYINILLDEDLNKDLIRQYLKDGEVFSLTYKENLACVAVVIKIDEDTIELKNIVTKEEYRGQGFAKKIIKYLSDNYKQKYKKIIVGTTENNIPFFVKQGFDKYEKTIKNYFVDNYKKEIWDGNLQCFDMYYYSKDLRRARTNI